MPRRLSRWTVALTILAAISVAVPATASGPRSKGERTFLVDMIGHHTMAVDMAEMAKEKAIHQELVDLADDIIAAQTDEMNRMRRWLRAWYDVEVDEDHMGHEDEDMKMLEEATGAEFEVRFISMMSVHHTQAIERARAVRQSRIHAKTRTLTRSIVRTQQREIDQLQEWLVAWYAN